MKLPATKILLVQGGLGDSVGPILERYGYRVVWVRTAKNALARITAETPSLVVIDMPSLRVSAEKLCQAIKRVKDVPVLMIMPEHTPAGATYDGAADAVVPRPLQLRRLLNRVEKLMPDGLTIELRCGDLVFRPADGVLRKRNEEQYLNPKLSKLLQLFMQRQGEVLSRKLLMQQVWDTSYLGDTRTLDVHIRWAREALEGDGRYPRSLKTVRGVGYVLETPAD